MAVQVRVRDKDSLAQFLGWFSIGLGTAQVTMPRTLCKIVGADDNGTAPLVMRLMGLRELTQGTGILTRPRPTTWLWSRVGGDVLDVSLLLATAVKNRKARTAFAIANVVAVTVPDVYESRFLSRKSGPVRSAKRIRKAVTIARPRSDVEAAWTAAADLRRKVDAEGATVVMADAPGDRGTELIVEFDCAPPAGDIGAVVQKLSGNDLATQLADDLRRLKQQIETGQIVRSDGAPDGHLLADHLKQRAAQPLKEGVR
ncbi:MAG: hypothetical protein JOZ99_05510 [Actinobacteria bacterium]|nr:hypothetical protein [Actinomycetota bacterium]